jgi:hypothetical protein
LTLYSGALYSLNSYESRRPIDPPFHAATGPVASCHYSLKTEKAHVFWAKRYIRFHRLRHPPDMGKAEVESFLTDLATVRKCAPSTHKQALAAI